MNEKEQPKPGSVGGGWLGVYAYRGALRSLPPVRFEATFTEPDGDGGFTGTILDDDGPGEADLSGGQSACGIRFCEVYRQTSLSHVSFEGTLSDDGRTMQGTWQIADEAHGVWEAHRLWSESAEDGFQEDSEERDDERVREVVRLG